MSSTAAPSSVPSGSVRARALLAGAVLAAFTAFSLWVVATKGYFGFLALAADEPWALQLLLDLVIACTFGIGWVVGDARRRGITSWPYVVATPFVGSMGILLYVVRRGLLPVSPVRRPS